MGFGSRLRYLIDKKGVTPYQISQETAISQATLSRLLSNSTTKPSIKNTAILANYFNVDQSWLLTGKDKMLKSAKDQLSQMTEEEIKVAIAGELVKMYEQGVLYPAAVHDKIVTKLEARIEELVRENSELRRRMEDMKK